MECSKGSGYPTRSRPPYGPHLRSSLGGSCLRVTYFFRVWVRLLVSRSAGPPQIRLLDVTVPSGRLKQLWPVATRTAAAETRCQAYLVAEMQRTPDRAPKPKAAILADCQSRFPGLSERGFDRAWAHAIVVTGAHWRRGGRPRHSRTGPAT